MRKLAAIYPEIYKLADFSTSGYTERPGNCLPRTEVRKNKNGAWFSQIVIIHRSSFIIFFFSSSLLRFFSSAFPRFPVFAHLLTLLTSHFLLFHRFLSPVDISKYSGGG